MKKRSYSKITKPSYRMVKRFKPRMRINKINRLVEKKYYDQTLASATISAASTAFAGAEADPLTVLCLSAPAQGDGENQRDGKKIVIDSVYVTGRLEKTTVTGGTTISDDTSYTVALVLDTQSNGAQLNSEDVFVNPSANLTGCPCPLRNLKYSKRFKVLGIQSGFLTPSVASNNATGTTISTGYKDVQFKFGKNNMNLEVDFLSSSEGYTAVVNNGLHVICICSASTNLTYNSRIRFVG